MATVRRRLAALPESSPLRNRLPVSLLERDRAGRRSGSGARAMAAGGQCPVRNPGSRRRRAGRRPCPRATARRAKQGQGRDAVPRHACRPEGRGVVWRPVRCLVSGKDVDDGLRGRVRRALAQRARQRHAGEGHGATFSVGEYRHRRKRRRSSRASRTTWRQRSKTRMSFGCVPATSTRPVLDRQAPTTTPCDSTPRSTTRSPRTGP